VQLFGTLEERVHHLPNNLVKKHVGEVGVQLRAKLKRNLQIQRIKCFIRLLSAFVNSGNENKIICLLVPFYFLKSVKQNKN